MKKETNIRGSLPEQDVFSEHARACVLSLTRLNSACDFPEVVTEGHVPVLSVGCHNLEVVTLRRKKALDVTLRPWTWFGDKIILTLFTKGFSVFI